MIRTQAINLVQNKIKNKNLVKHSLAVEAVMRALAFHFQQSQEDWALAGLLHDIDYEETKDKPDEHSLKGAQELEKLRLKPEIVQAVRAHNERHGLPRPSLIDKALYCVDPLTGLIVAAALVLPDKKLNSLSQESVLNRYREKSFARGANRQTMAACRELNLSLEEFVGIGLAAMQNISNDLGL